MDSLDSELLLGIDIGAAQVKVAVTDAEGGIRCKTVAPARANPIAVLAQLIRQVPLSSESVRVGVTGVGRSLWPRSLPGVAVNEIAATALAVKRLVPRARSIIDIGGQSSKWIRPGLDRAQSVADFSTNGLCAAGAGVFLEQQASRLGLSAQALGELAAQAKRGATVAGRCSVFAKSDMIHLQQAGTPPAEIAYGLCQALVRTFASSVLQGRPLERPVAIVGGSAANRGLLRAFREHFGLNDESLIVPGDAVYVGAIGAALQAVRAPVVAVRELLVKLEGSSPVCAWECGDARLPALSQPESSSTPAELENAAPPGHFEACIGIDVGSVSTDLVVLDGGMHVLQGIYLPTRGEPIEAMREGLRQIHERFGDRMIVAAVGCTGSGRYLAGKLVNADVIRNEITAQAASAALYYPDVDTIFEIGGQDSKFISLRDGIMVDFAMNKICSGGTGSFLEEQAERLGLRIQGEFSARAFQSAAPFNLGSRCTVFMDSELVRAQELGVPVEDLCAGLAYSVARNYLEKVVSGHSIGRHVVFQGGTASNGAVVAAFSRLLGCGVVVHPYNRLSGAIGAALLAARAAPVRTRFTGFDSCAAIASTSFECHRCENRCHVNRIRSASRLLYFGDICERYSELASELPKPHGPFPELFTARNQLFEKFIETATTATEERGERIGLLRASLNWEYLPFWAEFVRSLGFAPAIAPRVTSEMLQRSAGSPPCDVCLPIKAAMAQAEELFASEGVERLFIPTISEFPSKGREGLCHTCLFTQELPNLTGNTPGRHIMTAKYVFDDTLLGWLESCSALAQATGKSLNAVRRALTKAAERQRQFTEERLRLGRLALAAHFDRAVVVLGRPYNLHDPLLNLSLARHLERLGLPAIPSDLLPLEGTTIPDRWRTLPWHYSREQIRIVRWMRRDPRLFPLLVSSLGCGPDAFTIKHLDMLMRGKPHLLLEFDEHRGEAGLITRLEAFADQIEACNRNRKPTRRAAAVTPGPRPVPAGRRFFVPPFSEHARMYAAVLRAAGYEATVLPATNDESLRLGERHCSGRECHPYVLLAGDLVRFLGQSPRPTDVFLVPNCAQPCVIRQYGDAMRILLAGIGVRAPEIWEAAAADLLRLVGITGLARLYEGFLGVDLLLTLAGRLRPYEVQKGHIDHLLAGGLTELEQALSSCDDGSVPVKRAAQRMWSGPRNGQPGDLPVVGVTGDLYTRANNAGNHHLVKRLEDMGCEVWLGVSWAAGSDMATALDAQRSAAQIRLKDLAMDGLAWMLSERIRQRMREALPIEARPLILDPAPADLLRLARPYVGPATSELVVLAIGKLVDFLQRGADGAISAAGVNCAVGALIATAIPSIRLDCGGAPVISLACGATEGPADEMRLETFVQQVKAARRSGAVA